MLKAVCACGVEHAECSHGLGRAEIGGTVVVVIGRTRLAETDPRILTELILGKSIAVLRKTRVERTAVR